MNTPLVGRADVDLPDALGPVPKRPHVAVLVSLNFPDMTEAVAELVRRFTRNALVALTRAGASYTLVDSSVPAELRRAVAYGTTADALLVLGGGDVSATCYSDLTSSAQSEPVPNSYGVDEEADRGSLALLEAYADAGRPVLGICRGAQLINVAYGGSILPDIEAFELHRGRPGEPMFLDEKVEVVEDTRLARIIGAGPIVVRSGHHQAVDQVGDGLVVAARALDGIVEAIEDPLRWVLGVQFHPEDDDGGDRELTRLIGALIAAIY